MNGLTRYSTSTEIAGQAKLTSDLAKLQTQISSQDRLSAASDDPAAAARIAAIRRTQANDAVYSKNADTGTAIAGAVDNQLSTISSALNRANEILIAARSGTSSAADRSNLASELRGIAQDITGYSNATDTNGNPLFPDGTPSAIPVSDTLSISATASKSSVFTITDAGGNPISISDFLSAAADRLSNTATTDAAIGTDITTMGTALDHIASVQTDQGIREQRFTDAKDRVAATDTNLKIERSGLEDTDMSTALTDVQAKQLALQAAQTTFAQTHKSTLFDLLG